MTLAIFLFVVPLLSALIVQFICRKITSFKPSYGVAYVAVFIGHTVIFVFLTLVTHLTEGSGVIRGILLVILPVVTTGVVYGRFIRHPEWGPIGFIEGFQIILIQGIFYSIVWIILTIVIPPLANPNTTVNENVTYPLFDPIIFEITQRY